MKNIITFTAIALSILSFDANSGLTDESCARLSKRTETAYSALGSNPHMTIQRRLDFIADMALGIESQDRLKKSEPELMRFWRNTVELAIQVQMKPELLETTIRQGCEAIP